MSYLIRRVLAKPRLILDEMCRLHRKFVSYLRRVLCKTRLIFPRINGPIDFWEIFLIALVYPSENVTNQSCFPITTLTQALNSKVQIKLNEWKNQLRTEFFLTILKVQFIARHYSLPPLGASLASAFGRFSGNKHFFLYPRAFYFMSSDVKNK